MLKHYEVPKAIEQEFDTIYNNIKKNVPVNQNGSSIISYSYQKELKKAANLNDPPIYSEDDRKQLKKVLRTFPPYDEIYDKT